MKTGRLLKFQRPRGEVHAYLYRDRGVFCGAIYVLSGDAGRDGAPAHSVTAASERAVEAAVRAWVDAHFPKAR